MQNGKKKPFFKAIYFRRNRRQAGDSIGKKFLILRFAIFIDCLLRFMLKYEDIQVFDVKSAI